MAILLWILGMIAWVGFGVLAVYIVGLFERFTPFRSEGEGALLLFGPISLLMVLVIGTITAALMWTFQEKRVTKLSAFAEKIKSFGKGA